MDLRKELISAVKAHLGEDANRSGAVLYNGWSTLRRGKVYVIGLKQKIAEVQANGESVH